MSLSETFPPFGRVLAGALRAELAWCVQGAVFHVLHGPAELHGCTARPQAEASGLAGARWGW